MTITQFRLCIFSVFCVAPCLACFFSNPAMAEIYKCPNADGTIAFSDSVCSDGTTKAVTLQSNNLMDSSVERQNIVNYHQQKQVSKRNNSAPQVFLIVDSQAEERNARIGDQTATQTHQKNHKAKKRSKPKKKGKKKKQKKTDS